MELADKTSSLNDNIMLRLAREIAMDMRPIDEILKVNEVPADQWAEISRSVTFQGYLRRFVEEWHSATNTRERVVLKSLAFVEESLPEFYARAHDPKESLNYKVEVLKTVARLADLGNGTRAAQGGGTGEKFSVTINLGSDKSLKIEHDFNRNSDIIEGDVL